jgi:hypothetical protein
LAPLIFSPARTAKWHANNFRRFVQRRFFEGGRTKRTNACDEASILHDKLSELEEIVSSGQSVLNKRACFINDTHFQLANPDQAVCFRLWSFHQGDCHQQNKGSWATTSPDLAPLQTGLQNAKLVCHQTINNERGLISIHSLSLRCLIRGKWDVGQCTMHASPSPWASVRNAADLLDLVLRNALMCVWCPNTTLCKKIQLQNTEMLCSDELKQILGSFAHQFRANKLHVIA